MKEYLIPALGIIVTATILVLINEMTDLTFIKDYALLLIIAAMLLGVALAKASDKKG